MLTHLTNLMVWLLQHQMWHFDDGEDEEEKWLYFFERLLRLMKNKAPYVPLTLCNFPEKRSAYWVNCC